MDTAHGTFWVCFDHNHMPRYSSITHHLGHGHMTKTYPFMCIHDRRSTSYDMFIDNETCHIDTRLTRVWNVYINLDISKCME